ncbi:MAG: tetratricopeptide repeat protein, partial [Terriglobia bacterium]
VLFQSMGQLLWPVHFSPDYYYNQIPLISNWRSVAGLGVVGLCAILLGTLAWTYRHSKDAFFGLSFFLITYSIVSNLIVLTGTIRADRLLYMPSLGVFLLAGVAISRMKSSFHKASIYNTSRGVFALLLVVLAVRTAMQNGEWVDGLSLWTQAVRISPNSSTAHKALGVEYYERGRFSAALEQYQIAESIYPDDADLSNDMGTLLLRQGQTEEAISYLRRAVSKVPQPIARYNLALALRAQGNYKEAKLQEDAIIEYYDALIQKEPSNPNHHYFKANALYSQGNLVEALAEYRLALQIDPNYLMAKISIDALSRRTNTLQQPQ